MIAGVLTPAYGRDYKSRKEVQADFDAGKDFYLNYAGREVLINKADLIREGTRTIQVRYRKLTQTFILEVKE